MRTLVVNCGSSSIKYVLFDMADERTLAKGVVEKIGESTSMFSQKSDAGEIKKETAVKDHQEGMGVIVEALMDPSTGALKSKDEIGAVGHRVVHGGESFVQSTPITDEVIATIEEFSWLAPLHNPPNLTGIRAAMKHFPDVPHIAVFDTAFHQTMPKSAYIYALPYEFYEKDRIRKYGFHGTSHRFVTERAAEMLNKPLDDLNVITCHLGNGCSIAAVKGGKSIDTSMGLTPLEGVAMGTRSGDIDPAVVFFLQRRSGLDVKEVDNLLNKKSGLLGISGVSNDVRELLKAAGEGNERAKLAIDVFCYRIRKYIGAYLAALGRTDAIIFTAGIGENAVDIREKICGDLDNLGVAFDTAKNCDTVGKEGIISKADSRTIVMVIPTKEELHIARHTARIVKEAEVVSP